jgi:hypothetical protein
VTARKITKLTDEQWAQVPIARDEWLARGLATGPADRAEVERGITSLYAAAKRPPPPLTIWMDSPLGGLFAAAVLWDQLRGQLGDQLWGQLGDQLRGQLGDQLRGQLWGQLWGQLGDQLRGQLGDQLRGQLRGQLWGQLGDQLRGQLGDQLWGQLGGQLGDQLGDQLRGQLWGQLGGQLGGQLWGQLRGQLWGQLGDQLGGQLGGQLGDQLRGQLGDQLYRCGYGQHDIPWVAFYEFGRSIGVEYQQFAADGLDALAKLADGGWWWPFEGAVVLTDRPMVLSRDQDGRLHAERGPALAYADGYALWAWHGVRVPQDLIETGWTVEQIMRCENVEVRRCAIEKLGWDTFAAQAGLSLIATAPDPGNAGQTIELFDVPERIYGADVCVAIVTNGTPERDGTRRRYGLTTPREIRDPLAALAWTYELEPDQYALAERRT